MAESRETFKETLTRLLKAEGFNNKEDFTAYCKKAQAMKKNANIHKQKDDTFELDSKLYDEIESSVNNTIIPEIDSLDFSFLDKEMKQ